ncbi:MAG TPA: ECF-type sigma factor [Xanthomonadaceae bacterium]|nr:ECF-type sigma factor [Xanthomonadaceae bacterium]
MHETDTPVTELLAAIERGEAGASDALFPAVYQELRRLARSCLVGERETHTLSPTALVHEAYLRLVGAPLPAMSDRRHFLAIAAIAMRRILVEHARGLAREKRGGGATRITLSDAVGQVGGTPLELLDLDAALDRLQSQDAAMAQVVVMRYFGGLSVEEAAEVLDSSPRSVNRLWTHARAWLLRELDGTDGSVPVGKRSY